MFKRKKRKKQSNLNGGVKMLKSSSATVASSMVNFVLVYATELNLFVKPMWKHGPFIVIRIHLACILCFFLCCVVLSKRTKPKKIIVVLLLLSEHLQHTHRLETLVRIENERTEQKQVNLVFWTNSYSFEQWGTLTPNWIFEKPLFN